MKINWNYILGITTITGVVVITAYCVKLYIDQEKAEEDMITADEAMRLTKERLDREIDDLHVNNLMGIPVESGVVEEPITYHEDRVKPLEIAPDVYEHLPKEDNILRYEPNSEEARSQFVAMLTAEWLPTHDDYETLMYLFEFPFFPISDKDKWLKGVLADEREQFFGKDSKWVNRVTYAEVIIYYATRIEFEMDDRDRTYWANRLLENTNLKYISTADAMDKEIKSLNEHMYRLEYDHGGETWGLFALTEQDMLDIEADASVRSRDGQISYDMEYHKFLYSELEVM